MVALKEMVTKYLSIPVNRAVSAAAIKDALGDTPTGTVLGLADAEGSGLVGLTTNGGATATASSKALFLVPVPNDWVPGCKLGLRIRGKVTVARTVSATVDAVVKVHGDSLGSDICATDAQSINSTSLATKYFSITTTGLVPGLSVLSIVVSGDADDTGGSTNGAINISNVALEYEGRY